MQSKSSQELYAEVLRKSVLQKSILESFDEVVTNHPKFPEFFLLFCEQDENWQFEITSTGIESLKIWINAVFTEKRTLTPEEIEKMPPKMQEGYKNPSSISN